MHLLELKNVSVSYDAVTALQDCSLYIDEGEMISIVGSNGAGKTTTCKAISGVLDLKGGSVLFDGKDITKIPGYDRAKTLSGGEQQMLAIGRALMSVPRLLILDEPSLGLSPVNVQLVFEKLEEIRRSGVTVLLVEQNVEKSLRNSDRGYALENGKIVLSGTGKELLANDELKRVYLGM